MRKLRAASNLLPRALWLARYRWEGFRRVVDKTRFTGPASRAADGLIARAHTSVMYRRKLQSSRTWLGTPVQKTADDLLTLQELLVETRPDIVIETGTADGGSALFMATVADAADLPTTVISIDVQVATRPSHPRIRYLNGSSVSDSVVREVLSLVGPTANCALVLDSSHRAAHVLKELTTYCDLVGRGQWILVEDTLLGGTVVAGYTYPGPAAAVKAFLSIRPDFQNVRAAQGDLFCTFNPGGLLQRVRGD